MKTVNYKEMQILLDEYNQISSKVQHTRSENSRMAYLQTAISAVKDGVSLADLDRDRLNDTERRSGIRVTKFAAETLTPEQRAQAQLFRTLATGERRDVEGSPMLSHLGTYSGMSRFVPTSFFAGVFSSLKAYDFLFDPDFVTFIKTANGRVMTVPTISDTEHDAAVVAEAGSQTSTDIADPNQATLGVYSYASRRWTVSLEAIQDLDSSLSAFNLFQNFTSKAIARGVGRDLVTGDGNSKPLGLVPALAAAGGTVVIAAGSASNTGGAESGANSIGSKDLSNALSALDPAYIGPKSAFAMNNTTLNTLRALTDKQGHPLNIVVDGESGPMIFGLPVKIAPSLDNIGASNTPILVGDFSYWATRIATADDIMGIQAYHEAPGLIEFGLVGFRSFVRAGGALLWQDASSPCPIIRLSNHS